MGSTLTTSRAAPPSVPLFSASATAASSISGPRAVFSRNAPRFISASRRAFIMPVFSGNSGQCRDTTSARPRSSSRPTNPTPGSGSLGAGSVYTRSSIPKALASLPTTAS